MSSIPEGLPPLSQTPGARSTATLSRDLADFLVEFGDLGVSKGHGVAPRGGENIRRRTFLDRSIDAMARTLLRGGIVITSDPSLGTVQPIHNGAAVVMTWRTP